MLKKISKARDAYVQSALEREFAARIREIGSDLPPYRRNYRFCERMWTFDYAWVDCKLAIEIDGGNQMVRWSKKLRRYVAVGRHTKSTDYAKLNRAVLLGWRILRYTGEMLRQNPVGCINDLREALSSGKDKEEEQ